MNVRRWIGDAARIFLRGRGYELMHRGAMRFGIDPVRDVRLLAGRMNKSIEVCFDVGANEGQTALSMLEEFPNATVHSFEPVPETFARLQARTSSETRIRPHMHALSDEAKVAQIYTYESSLLASLNPSAPYTTRSGAPGRSQSCDVKTLDSFCSENGIEKIDYLKIDTESNDLNVLRGGSRMLRSGVSFVSVELNSFGEDHAVPSLKAFNQILEPAGYRCVTTYVDEVHIEMDFMIIANAMFVYTGKPGG